MRPHSPNSAGLGDGASQLVPRPGVLELGWGQPDPVALPSQQVAAAALRALHETGGAALSYGRDHGPLALEKWLVQRHRQQGTPAAHGEVFVSAGASAVLDRVCAVATRAGDRVLVEQRTYDLAVRIFRDRGLIVEPVPCDREGVLPEALERHLVRSHPIRVGFVYLVPTFNNPTGSLLSADRRQAIGALASRHDVLVVEDDAYRELWDRTPPPKTIRSYAPHQTITVGSMSKSMAPGLRVGWAVGPSGVIDAMATSGLTASGGCAAHLQALVVAALAATGEADLIIEQTRLEYVRRREALESAMRCHLPTDVTWTAPHGGYFSWLSLPARLQAARLAAIAEERHGVSVVLGAAFEPGGSTNGIRVSIARYEPAVLCDAARRLARAMLDAHTETTTGSTACQHVPAADED